MSSINEYIPVMEIEENFYKFRRMGIDEVEAVIKIATKLTTEGFSHLQIRLQFLREIGATNAFRDQETGEYDKASVNNLLMMLTMAFGIQEIKNSFYELVAATLRKTDKDGNGDKKNYVSIDELRDPDLFPAYSIAHLGLHLVMHPDFELLKNAVVEGSKLPFFRRTLEEVTDLAGQEFKKALESLPLENETPTTPTDESTTN